MQQSKGARQWIAGMVAATTVASLAAAPAHADAEAVWSDQFGTHLYDEVSDVAVAPDGTTIVAGWTDSVFDRSNRDVGAFLAAYDRIGEEIWFTEFGSSGTEIVEALALGPSGEIYVAGSTRGDLFGPNGGFASADGFLARFRGDGVVEWGVQVGGPGDERWRDVAVASDGSVVVGGSRNDDLATFDGSDATLSRYRDDGTLLWSQEFGTSGFDSVFSVAIGPDGMVMVSGQVSGDLHGPHQGRTDAFLRRYRLDGSIVWGRQFGTSGNDGANQTAVSGSGRIAVSGQTTELLHPSNTLGVAADGFVRVYSPDGSMQWADQYGTDGTTIPRALTFLEDGSVLVAGSVDGTFVRDHAGRPDAYALRYLPSGALVDGWQAGSNETDEVLGIAAGPDGTFTVAGYTLGGLVDTQLGRGDGFVLTYPIGSGRGSCVTLPSPFVDVAGSFAETDVACILSLGVTTGTSPNTYAPTNTVTREQMAAFLARLWRAAGGDCDTTPTPFTDVAPTSFAANDIACIYNLDITTGTSPTTYAPTNTVTREQMAAFLARLWRALGDSPAT